MVGAGSNDAFGLVRQTKASVQDGVEAVHLFREAGIGTSGFLLSVILEKLRNR